MGYRQKYSGERRRPAGRLAGGPRLRSGAAALYEHLHVNRSCQQGGGAGRRHDGRLVAGVTLVAAITLLCGDGRPRPSVLAINAILAIGSLAQKGSLFASARRPRRPSPHRGGPASSSGRHRPKRTGSGNSQHATRNHVAALTTHPPSRSPSPASASLSPAACKATRR